MWLALDHLVILAADRLMPTDLFSVPSGMILGVITTEGSGQSRCPRQQPLPGHELGIAGGAGVPTTATAARSFWMPPRASILDLDAMARQQAARICERAKTKKCGCWAASPATPRRRSL